MAAAGTPKDDTGLERKMESRHLTMISLGGVIGTGLFVSSGYTIHQAGPLGAILAYAVGSLLVYCVMVSLGELSVAMPYAGSFHMYAKRFIGPGTAFTIAILYWLNWAVALASEFTAAGLLMQRWFPHSPSWVWSAVFIVVVFAHGMVAGQGAADSRAIRQDEFPWCAGVGRTVQHGGFAAGAAVFRARRLDRVIWCWSQYPVWRRWWCGSPCACAISVSGVNGRGTGTAPMSSTTVRPVSRCCRGWPRCCLPCSPPRPCNLVLVAVSGLATLVVWFSVCVCHIRFRREWARDGHSADELDYRAPGFPVLPWLAIVMCIGALVLVVLDETQRSTLIA